jgi:serine/threonine-protein kinase
MVTVSPSRATSLIAGRYTLEGPLGRGGMAEVQAGTDLRLQRPVAVKLLLPEMAARDDIRRRFEAEARAAASFNDPHAVAVYDTGEHEGTPYIVMERLPGETLADRIAAGPQDPKWVRRVACEVLGALAAAHAVGLVHRDVKPGNILVTADDHAKINDFGIAKSLEATDGSLDLTGTGQLLGTPAYLPPERLDGGPATTKSDLYSLGVVLYEALTGRCPFPGETPIAAAAAIVAGEYEPLDQARPGLDPALVTTVDRAMATDPDRRFDSASAMAAALTPRAAGAGAPTVMDAGGRAGMTSVLDLRDLTQTHAAAPAAVAVAGAARGPRFRLPLALLVGLLFVALLVAGLNRRDRNATTRPASVQTESTPAPNPTTRAQTPQTTAATVVTVPSQPFITVPATTAKAKDKPKGKD